MESLLRLVPFVLQQRRALIVSVLFSIGAALFTVAQLSLIYPAMKLLLEGKTFNQHVQSELQLAQTTIETESRHVAILNGQMQDALLQTPEHAPEFGRLRDERDRAQADLSKAIRNEWIFQRLSDNLMPWLPNDPFNCLGFLLGTLLVLTLVKEACSFSQELLVGHVVQRIMQSLRQHLFRTTLRLDQQTLALETTPTLMSRFTFDLSQVANGLLLLGSKIVVEPLKAVVFIGGAFLVNWRLTLLSFVCAPVLLLLFGGLGKKLKRAAQRQMESMSRIYQVLEEALLSIRTVQAYRNERLHRRRLHHEHRSYYEKAMRILQIDVLVSPTVEFLAMCAVFIASLPGAYLVLRHKTSIWGIHLASEQMTVSDLMLLYSYMIGVLDPGRKLSGIYSKLKKSATACGRVFAWMDRESLLPTLQNPTPLPRHSQSIQFEQVTFHYALHNSDELGRRALNDVTVTIPFGATVAVVGENGCGKSTLVNLLPRFFDPHEGQIRIDGIDIRHVDASQLRGQIGIVAQDTCLFDSSIADNICYGKSNATRADLQTAAERAFVTDFVSQLPEGFATAIGDKGHRLSGGQRQRIALARAILRDPAILILDEATSAIDTQSEQRIHEALKSFARERTTLIVTHAMTPSLLNCITHVLVMDQGQVLSFGSHDDVLATCPYYQRLFESQTSKRSGTPQVRVA